MPDFTSSDAQDRLNAHEAAIRPDEDSGLVSPMRDALIKSHGLLERSDRVLEQADARATAAEATVEAIRTALGGYHDSDLVSLATTLNARNEALEVANENMREALEHIAEFALHPDLADALKTMAFIASAVLAEQDEDNDE